MLLCNDDHLAIIAWWRWSAITGVISSLSMSGQLLNIKYPLAHNNSHLRSVLVFHSRWFHKSTGLCIAMTTVVNFQFGFKLVSVVYYHAIKLSNIHNHGSEHIDSCSQNLLGVIFVQAKINNTLPFTCLFNRQGWSYCSILSHMLIKMVEENCSRHRSWLQ